jgi:hypothetical protein
MPFLGGVTQVKENDANSKHPPSIILKSFHEFGGPSMIDGNRHLQISMLKLKLRLHIPCSFSHSCFQNSHIKFGYRRTVNKTWIHKAATINYLGRRRLNVVILALLKMQNFQGQPGILARTVILYAIFFLAVTFSMIEATNWTSRLCDRQ